MQWAVEQGCVIKFHVTLNKCATETLVLLQEAYGKNSLSKTQVFRWYKNFKDGREGVYDEQCTGSSSSFQTLVNVSKIKAILDSDHLMSVQKIADTLGLSK